jgi:hypothetical protein
MPVFIVCHICQRRLRVADNLLGKKIQCPSCSTIINAPPAPLPEVLPVVEAIQEAKPPPGLVEPIELFEEAYDVQGLRPPPPGESFRPPPPPHGETRPPAPEQRTPDDDDGDEEDELRPRYKRSNWKLVRLGITLQMAAMIAHLLAFLLTILRAVLIAIAIVQAGGNAQAEGADVEGSTAYLLAIAVLFNLGGVLASMTGVIFCLFAPTKYGTRALAIANVGMVLCCVLLFCLAGGSLAISGRAGLGLGVILLLADVVLGVAQQFVYFFFLRAVAHCLSAGYLGKSIQNLIVLWGAVLGVYIVLAALTVSLLGSLPGGPRSANAWNAGGFLILIGCCGWLNNLVVIVALVRYIQVLNHARGEITYYLSGRASV